MKVIETSMNKEGFISEIKINDNVIEKLQVLMDIDEKQAYNDVYDSVIEKLNDMSFDNELQPNKNINSTVTIAYENKDNFFSYKQITLNLKLNVSEYGLITGAVTL